MKGEPHVHKINVDGYQSHWYVTYGDQNKEVDKPLRFWWDSEEAYAKRSARALRAGIVKLIRKHDRASLAAPKAEVQLPEFDPTRWASEQL